MTPDDETRKAANELADRIYSKHGFSPEYAGFRVYFRGDVVAAFVAGAEYARAVLAAGPGDDGEPIDRAFMVSVGWVDDWMGGMKPAGGNPFRLSVARDENKTIWLIVSVSGSGDAKIVANPTKGRIRALMAVFGIPTTPPEG